MAINSIHQPQTMTFSGDTTYYTPGLGACGQTHTGADHVAALAAAQYGHGANANQAAVCGRQIRIHCGGESATATVVDNASGSVDVSPAVFRQLASLDEGQVEVVWEFI
ncbi:RlpA-like double-psi beta-barrel-protein domain-containing protein-containing protein [Camillea tinctor]|nr:RlpA-like double-psi beta-barrel-protein domain-containing protein-containing protein [Camillea tinctor]